MITNPDTLHESARAVALEAASRIVADDSESYSGTFSYANKLRTQATLTMAHEFYRFIVHGDTNV